MTERKGPELDYCHAGCWLRGTKWPKIVIQWNLCFFSYPRNSKIYEKEPRYNEGPTDWQNLFAITRFRCIEVLLHTFYYLWGKKKSFVIPRTLLYRGSTVTNKGKKVWKGAKSVFQWRFRWQIVRVYIREPILRRTTDREFPVLPPRDYKARGKLAYFGWYAYYCWSAYFWWFAYFWWSANFC